MKNLVNRYCGSCGHFLEGRCGGRWSPDLFCGDFKREEERKDE